MFKIDMDANVITKLPQQTFSGNGIREVPHLQEWIAKNPNSLGEDLLIIQKEFAGFDDTNERLDLLALDKEGNLVVIENKLDDSGRDVVWQGLKYAAYCSILKKSDIIRIFQEYLNKYSSGKSALGELSVFYNGQDIEDVEINTDTGQRLILVAANF